MSIAGGCRKTQACRSIAGKSPVDIALVAFGVPHQCSVALVALVAANVLYSRALLGSRVTLRVL